MTNTYCDALGIEMPDLEVVKDRRDANTYSLLLVALLERGEPMTLGQVARRFEEAGVAPQEEALRSLQRCRPARPPVYRDGDRYALDPHDDQLDLWAFRLGLRPPKAPRLSVVRPPPEPSPGDDVPLTVAELEEAWSDAGLYGAWSAQRLAAAVLEAHGRPMRPEEAVSFVTSLTRWQPLRVEEPHFARRGSPVRVCADGSWEVVPGHQSLRAARRVVRDRLAKLRSREAHRPDPAVWEAQRRAAERRRAAHAKELARLRRVLLHAFPVRAPRTVVTVDVADHTLRTYLEDEFPALRERLGTYGLIAAENVRPLLSKLDFDPGDRRLSELGPPQKTKRLNRRGRTLKITTALLVQGSCGISRPFGDEKKLRGYLEAGQTERLRRRLEADAKSLYAFYQYGRLHGAVRLRWGFLDEMLPAPWVHRDESTLFDLMRRAEAEGGVIELVEGSAPGWNDPWARSKPCEVAGDLEGYTRWLVDESGWVVDERDVQAARLRAG